MQLDVVTIQLSKHRLLRGSEFELIDTSFQSGVLWLAPSRELLWGYKGNHLTSREYFTRYKDLCRQRYRRHPEQWQELIRRRKIALACYCKADCFCHRLILKNILEKLCEAEGIDFWYGGEITR